LQIESWLNPIAKWLWSSVCYERFADWVLASRLHSMQQRRPEHAPRVLTSADVSQFLATRSCTVLSAILSGDMDRFIAALGLDVLLDGIEGKEHKLEQYCSANA